MGNVFSNGQFSRASMSRNNSSVDFHHDIKPLLPHEKLAKILVEKSHLEGQEGVHLRMFVKLVFNRYPELGLKLFNYMLTSCEKQPEEKILSEHEFVQQTEKILSLVADKKIITTYVSMFGSDCNITTGQFRELIQVIYQISMDHYPGGLQHCTHLNVTLDAIVESVFHNKSQLTCGYVSNWLEMHCYRLVTVLHRYVVHVLSTSHRTLENDTGGAHSGNGIELTTPVLESAASESENSQPLLPVSQVWLLAAALPQTFTKPSSQAVSPSSNLTSAHLLSKMLDVLCPSHWTLLYNSNQHGLGSNRFVYHVSSYRGPTLTFLRGTQGVEFCVGSTDEWRESHMYWGGSDSIILQILPKFQILFRGEKSIYLNLSIRGYPKGIRGGSDPRKPIIEVNPAFTVLTYSGIPYELQSVEVWGCGNPHLRETQLDIKRWEGKEIEKARKVKISADDWIDHPDRYLLELAGRQSYNTTS